MPGGPTAANTSHAAAAVDSWDRQTEEPTKDSFIDPALHYYASSVKKQLFQKLIYLSLFEQPEE